MDGLQALQAGTVRPPEGKIAASEGPDGEVRGGRRSSLVRMRDMDPPEVPLRQGPYNTPQDVASNPRSLVQVAQQAHPLVQRRPYFSESNARASKQPYAPGGCCGRGRYSAWVTTGYPRGSCRESSRTRGNVGRGGRSKSGRTAWQMIFGYLASRGSREPPHLTLGRGITRYTTGVVGLWPRG